MSTRPADRSYRGVIPGWMIVLVVGLIPAAYAAECPGEVRRDLEIGSGQNGFPAGLLGGNDFFGVGVASLGDLDGDGVGDLDSLTASDGDYGQAIDECLINDTPSTSMDYGVAPVSGQGYWFLVRRVLNAGNGTYDSCGAGQSESRDVEIAGSGVDCP